MSQKLKPRRKPVARKARPADVSREAGALAAASYLRHVGATGRGVPPVIGRDVWVTVPLLQKLGPRLAREAREARIRATALILGGTP